MHEYKVVPAPARAVKQRGLKTTEDRFAKTLADALNEAAAEGWEFLRSETLPCTERKGFTGSRTTTQVVLIFRRGTERAQPDEAAVPPPPLWARSAAGLGGGAESEPAHRRQEPLFRPGALSRDDTARSAPPLHAPTEYQPGTGLDDDRNR